MAQDQLSQDLASLKIDRSAKPTNRSGLYITLAILAIIAGIVYFVVLPRVRSALSTTELRVGRIEMVSQQQASVQLTATGYVVAEVYAKVAAKVPGRIAEIFVEEGQLIEKGAKVARLEDVDSKSAVAAARSRAAAARARISISRGALTEAKVQLDREKPLVEKGVTPKATVDDLETRIQSLQAAVKASEAEAAAADAEANSMEVQLSSFLITSPISGTVVDKLVEVGEGVSPGFGTPGVVEVVDMNSLVVEVDVPESKLHQVVAGRATEIVLDAYPTKTFRGAVKEIGYRVNRAKATVPVKVKFVERPDKALPEMAARVNFLGPDAKTEGPAEPQRLVVPSSAIAQRNGRDVVFVFEDEQVRQLPVTLGPPFADGRELKSDIPAGTKVVLDPPANLTDGQKVKEKR